MSYDSVDVLSRFARDHGIDFPLLSDEGSDTIRALGLENSDVAAHNEHFGLATDERHVGLPYPGTFRLDAAGVVTEKWFEQSHRVRPSSSVLLADLLGEVSPLVEDYAEAAGVRVAATLPVDAYHPQQIYQAKVRLGIPDDRHVYVGSVPDGFVTLEVALSGPGSLVQLEPRVPRGRPFELLGIPERFEVVDGIVEVVVPFRIDEQEGDVAIHVETSFQTCTERECFPPVRLSLTLPLEDGGLLRRS